MSCIAGIIDLDGAPVDRRILEKMIGSMRARAPDTAQVEVTGNMGLGHAGLWVSPESSSDQQPFTLDGVVWIVADARIDGRKNLEDQLRSRGRQVRANCPDAELILHAYHAFGESLTDYLIGDFAIALWDGRRKTLLCLRDHFGIRPLYYTLVDRLFVFASDIGALLTHPALSRQLNESAVGDFLLFGVYMDPAHTIYQDVHCLPSAGRLRVSAARIDIDSYWTLSQTGPLRYRRTSTYVEHFAELLDLAVTDRVRSDQVAIELSGGLDSSAITAVAAKRARDPARLKAYTYTATRVFPDNPDNLSAQSVAAFLPISLAPMESGCGNLFDSMDQAFLATAEPINNPFLGDTHRNLKTMGDAGVRVLLTGHGGDAVFDNSDIYFGQLLRRGQFALLGAEVLRHAWKTRSFKGTGLRSALTGNRPARPGWIPDFPGWLRPDFVSRAALKERYEFGWNAMFNGSGCSYQLSQPWLSRVFTNFEALALPIVMRHPYYDLRLVEFLNSLPGFTRRDKGVLRESMQGLLPEAVRMRPKYYPAGNVVGAAMASQRTRVPPGSELPGLDGYVDVQRYWPAYRQQATTESAHLTWDTVALTAVISFDFWCKNTL